MPPPDPNFRLIKQRHWRARLWQWSICECEGKICEAYVGSYRWLRLRLLLLQKRHKFKKIKAAEKASRVVSQHLRNLVVQRQLRASLARQQQVPLGAPLVPADNRIPTTPPRWFNDWTGC